MSMLCDTWDMLSEIELNKFGDGRVCVCCALCWCHRFSARRAADWGPVETGPSGRSVLSVTRGGGSAMAVT